ncbi:hypothetical protein IEK_05427 [Bacillus toyonensis]|uniref:hypothetical protein n=1 Tax=Bacillus cereus group TaxID=86661 RepID=UPI00027BEFF8|nr:MULTISPECIES: hypothetical protein [Bacillus cereus group]EJV43348.1 hypothetical protein IEK_05427 [Bacillus toyonensis]OQD25592.1 hypothetical protein B1K97_05225 [Bacillus toyonensis]PED95095.1 hypothetical protein CON78_29400 [Bacillus toyonensis]PFX85492.1 hypothetical protein COL40_21065 [Bacillus toyonensis]PHC07808.1 hypothetical protein COE97_28260 [Bacillus toyonensis]
MPETNISTFTYEYDVPAKSKVTVAIFAGNKPIESRVNENTGDTSLTTSLRIETTSPVSKVEQKITKL